jgi:hypothetical protein
MRIALMSLNARLLGVHTIPHDLEFDGTVVGGLSGIDFDPESDRYFLISDDRSERNPARFYIAHFNIDDRGFSSFWFGSVVYFRRPDGRAYPNQRDWAVEQRQYSTAERNVLGTVDPEEIRWDSRTGTLLWCQEGINVTDPDGTEILVNLAVRESDVHGNFIRDLPTPLNETVGTASGPRVDHALESLTLASGGDLVVTVLEDPLIGDGPEPTAAAGGRSRITVQSRDGALLAQYAYDIEPLPGSAGPAEGNLGIPSMLAWTKETRSKYIIIERAFVNGYGNRIQIYQTDLANATDIRDLSSAAGSSSAVVPAEKSLLVDLKDIGLDSLENVEGCTWGPDLPSGERTLVLVSDNNFASRQQTQLIAIAVPSTET